MSTVELNGHSVRSIEEAKQQIKHTIILLHKAYLEFAKEVVIEDLLALIDALIETTEQVYSIEHIIAPQSTFYNSTRSKAFKECILQLHNHHTHLEFISIHTFSFLIDYLTHLDMLLNRSLRPLHWRYDN